MVTATLSAFTFSEADHPLAYRVAGEQKDAEGEYEGCRSNFGAAHQHAPVARPLARKPRGKRFRTER